jgi:hypothetical protein
VPAVVEIAPQLAVRRYGAGGVISAADDAAPGLLPGTDVRSIAAEDYRLARDRRASFGRRKEEASAQSSR